MQKLNTSLLYKLTLALLLGVSNVFAQEIEWQNTIGGSSVDALSTVRQTTDGGYILGGYSYSNSSGNKTENCLGRSDYWIVKVDCVGTIMW